VASLGTTTGFVVSVNYDGIPTNNPVSQIVGLAKADFILTNSLTKAVISLSGATMTDNGDGTYTFTGATIPATASYSVSLVATAAISVVSYQLDTLNAGTFTLP
jgi:hypothetical protein